MLEGTCADNPESRRIHAADGMVLGTSSADCHGQLQPCLGRAPGVSSAEGTCAGTAVVGPAVEGSGLPLLVGSCADNWSVQLLDNSLVRITRVSSCLRTLVRITNCPRRGVWGFGNSEWKSRVMSCSVHHIGGHPRADLVQTMQTMQTFQTRQDHRK